MTGTNSPACVMVGQGSPTVRSVDWHIVARDPRHKLVAVCANAEEAPQSLPIVRPDAGGFSLADDKSNGVVNGMPVVAIRRDAISEFGPLEDIAGKLIEVVSETGR